MMEFKNQERLRELDILNQLYDRMILEREFIQFRACSDCRVL